MRRIIHNSWFIQSEEGKQSEEEKLKWIAWASKVRTQSPLEFVEPIYFNFGETEKEAIEKVIDEIDNLCPENVQNNG